MRSLFLLSLAVAALAVIVSPPAMAKPPPRGNKDGAKEGGATRLPILVERAKMTATELIQSAKMVPYIAGKGKRLSGYLLSNVVPTTAFALLSLQDGDIVTGVNGVVVTDAKSGVDVVQVLEGSDAGEIKFLRQGKERSVKYKKR